MPVRTNPPDIKDLWIVLACEDIPDGKELSDCAMEVMSGTKEECREYFDDYIATGEYPAYYLCKVKLVGRNVVEFDEDDTPEPEGDPAAVAMPLAIVATEVHWPWTKSVEPDNEQMVR